MGNFPILGPDHDSWSTENGDDLLMVQRRESSDPFSRWLINSFIPWFHKLIGKRFKVRLSLSLLFLSLPQVSSLLSSHLSSLNPFLAVINNSLQKPIPSDFSSEIVYYAEAPLHSTINIFVTVLACLIPISSILVLYFVSNLLDRLAITVGFTGLFAFCLALTTRARRVEIFAATST
jgi:hypothetical protein